MDRKTIGVVGSTGKANERRRPLHPLHFDRVDEGLRGQLLVEAGYGDSQMTVLSDLGSSDEKRLSGTAAQWIGAPRADEE